MAAEQPGHPYPARRATFSYGLHGRGCVLPERRIIDETTEEEIDYDDVELRIDRLVDEEGIDLTVASRKVATEANPVDVESILSQLRKRRRNRRTSRPDVNAAPLAGELALFDTLRSELDDLEGRLHLAQLSAEFTSLRDAALGISEILERRRQEVFQSRGTRTSAGLAERLKLGDGRSGITADDLIHREVFLIRDLLCQVSTLLERIETEEARSEHGAPF